MYPKKPLNNYCEKTSIENNFAVINTDKTRLDLLTLLVLCVTLLWIIPINFEKLLNPILDIRNISYFLILFILLPYFGHIINEVNKNAKIIWTMFFLYFALEGLLYYYHWGSIKSMYYAVWMLLTVGTVFYVGGSPRRLSMLYKMVVFCIAFSVVFGLLEVIFGEPFTSIRLRLIGRMEIEQGAAHGLLTESGMFRLKGLSARIFGFSYQLVMLPVSSFALFLYSKTRKAKWFWIIILIISILGIFSNAERSAALSSLIGLLFLYGIVLLKTKNKKYIMWCVLLTVLIFSTVILLQKSEKHKQKFGLGTRIESTEQVNEKARLLLQIAGMKTVLKNPLGVGVSGRKDYYNFANEYQVVSSFYRGTSYIADPHNHFINVGFHAGWGGIFLAVVIFIYIKKCIDVFRYKVNFLEDRFAWIFYGIIMSFFANLLNSCFHNTGIFWGEPGGLLMLAFIGAGASMTLKQF